VADVFISSARADHGRIAALRERFASLGYSVFWDDVRADSAARERELGEARAVLVVWSDSSRHSTWMCAEASLARDAGKLAPMRLDGAQPPPPFDTIEAPNMAGERVEWGPLEAKLTALVRGGPKATEDAARVGLLATPAAAGMPKLLTIALATSLAAFATALSAADTGMMTPDQLQIALTGMIGVAGACAALCVHRLIIAARAGS
jgi:hypothetical protein